MNKPEHVQLFKSLRAFIGDYTSVNVFRNRLDFN